MTPLDKSRKAASFQFREPEVVVHGNATKWRTGFRAFVPQSQLWPPIPYDTTLASAASYPEFSVQVDHFLADGYSWNGDQKIDVSRGALKVAFNITNWDFAQMLQHNPVLSCVALKDEQAQEAVAASANVATNATSCPSPTPFIVPKDVDLRRRGVESTKYDRIAIILLAFLGLVAVVRILCCTKRVSIQFDFSKVTI